MYPAGHQYKKIKFQHTIQAFRHVACRNQKNLIKIKNKHPQLKKTLSNRKMGTMLENIKPLIIDILIKNNVISAGVFGSYARGDEKEDSDVDLLIEFKGGQSLFDLVGLKQELEEMTNLKFNVLTYNSIHYQLKTNILNEEIKIL